MGPYVPLRRSSNLNSLLSQNLSRDQRAELREHLQTSTSHWLNLLYEERYQVLVELLVGERDNEAKARLQGQLEGMRWMAEIPHKFIDTEGDLDA